MNLKDLSRLARVLGGLLLVLLGSREVKGAPRNSPWNETYFPNITLTDQDGRKLKFYDDLIRGKVVAINFFYTHCKEMCPAETANLIRVEKQLGDRVGKDVFFYSISIDPKFDSPAALREYKKRFKIGKNWTFLTGKAREVTLLRTKLGLLGTQPEAQKLKNHTMSFLVGNEKTGIWIKRSAFDHPKVLGRLLGSTLHGRPSTQGGSQKLYADAKRIPTFSRTEDTFKSRCVACHATGTEDGIGPGLAGVTLRRSEAWLTRWLKEPDKMIQEKDPVGLALYEKYNRVQMPNMNLTDLEVADLIKFLRELNSD